MITKLLSFAFITLILCSCGSTNLKDFYFPIEDDDESTKVFLYVNKKNPELSEYWKITSDPFDNTLKTESYFVTFELYNTFIEEYDEDGAKLTGYIDYELDSAGLEKEIVGSMVTDEVYKWNRKESYHYSVDYITKYGRFKFLKKRTDLGFKKIKIDDETYKCIKFKDEYFINAIDQNDKYNFHQISYYAEGVGMVKYERYIPNAEVRILELQKVITGDEFETLKNQHQKRMERKSRRH